MVKNVSNRDMNLGIIVEAKQQYTKQLMNVMKPIVYEGLFDMYTKSIENCKNEDDLLVCFQNELKQVPKWNADVIKESATKMTDSCSYFNDLLTAVFLSNVRILTSVKLGSNKKRKVKLVVPTNDTFVHKVYVNVAKSIYNDPFTFSNRRYNGNVLRNMNDVYPVIETAIEDTIRDMLPIQNILESYLGETMSESDSDDQDSEHQGDLEDFPNKEEDPEDFPNKEEDPEDPTADFPAAENESTITTPEPENDFFAKPVEEIKDIPLGPSPPPPHREEEEEPVVAAPPRPAGAVPRKSFFDDVQD